MTTRSSGQQTVGESALIPTIPGLIILRHSSSSAQQTRSSSKPAGQQAACSLQHSVPHSYDGALQTALQVSISSPHAEPAGQHQP